MPAPAFADGDDACLRHGKRDTARDRTLGGDAQLAHAGPQGGIGREDGRARKLGRAGDHEQPAAGRLVRIAIRRGSGQPRRSARVMRRVRVLAERVTTSARQARRARS